MPALRRFLARAQSAAAVRGEVAVRLVDDAAICRLNRQFRHHDRPTDVLSFPTSPWPLPPGLPARAGDLAISLDTAARQARQLGHSPDTELRVLLLHGLLHLAGMDHETDGGEMLERELHLRRRFRLPAGLIERSRQAQDRGEWRRC